MEGTPTLLIHKGKIFGANLAKEQITHEELLQALREHGIANVEEVQTAMIEIDGSISVLKKEEMPTVAKAHHHIRFLKRKN